ncbi:MAG: ABC-2 transporter permease [Pseudomonadota bacterium]
MNSVFWALVRKDLYLLRGFMVAMLGSGILGIVIMALGSTVGLAGASLAVGGILFLTANVAGGIFLASYALLSDRKELTRLFALTLPISGPRYDQAKLLGGYLAFLIPWAALTVLVLVPSLLPGGVRGMVVYALVIQCFVLALFSVVMGTLFVVTTEAASGIMILTVNILFSLFMVSINQPPIIEPMKTAQITWTPFALWMLAGEFVVICASMVFTTSVIARRRDHI